MKLKGLLFFLLSLTVFSEAFAQDLHWTQFYASPLHLNAGNTGNYVGDWRIVNNIRDQWRASGDPFTSLNLDFDQPFQLGDHRLSAGIMLMSDQSGPHQLSKSRIYGTVAYQKKMNGHVFNFGAQPGYIKSGISNEGIIYNNDFDNSAGQHVEGFGSGDAVSGQQTSNFDLNIGVTWQKKMGNITPMGGISFKHLLAPNETFGENNDARLYRRQIYHVGAMIELSKIYVAPNLFYSYSNGASEMMAGSNVGYYIAKNPYKIEAIFAGVMFRHGIISNGDAGAIIAGINFKNLDVGVSYDFTFSDMLPANNGLGGVEISIIYTAPSTLLKKTTIPCERL